MSKMPTKWKVPDGWVLTWYPEFTYAIPQTADRTIWVYDNDEPFVPQENADGDVVGYNPNGHFDLLGETLIHPGQYALNIAGEEPGFDPSAPLHPDAVQVHGKVVSS